MLYVVGYPEFASADGERIEAFRRNHEPERAALVAAHVTLVFGISSVAAKDLIGRVETLAVRTPSFPVTLDGVSIHADAGRSTFHLFLEVGQGREVLAALHRSLHEGQLAAELRPGSSFDPHVTVATSGAAEAIEAARRQTGVLGLPLAGRIGALHVLRLAAGRLDELAVARLASNPALN